MTTSWNTLSNFGIAELRNCEDSEDSRDSGDRPHVLERGLKILLRFEFVAPLQPIALTAWRLKSRGSEFNGLVIKSRNHPWFPTSAPGK